MSEKPYNPDDPGFLISRSLDQDLSDDERRRLDQVLAESESLRAEADRLRAVDRLIKRWGARPVELDWEPHAATVHARVAGGDEDKNLRKLDGLLKLWGERRVSMDGERFTEAVMARVGATRRRSSTYALIFRLAVPLAAAAAVAFALTATFRSGRSDDRVCHVAIGPQATMVEPAFGPTEQPKPVISFRRSSDTAAERARQRRSTAGISTVWASPVSDLSAECAPL